MENNNQQSNNQITEMRSFMFDQMRRLNDPQCDIEKEIKRTEAMVNVSKTLIDSAKVEVDFIRVTNSAGTGFIPGAKNGQKQLENAK
jgi:hypothetical protein